MKGNIFSPEDKEFMEIVQSDLRKYLQKNIFPSRTVLVFPPFNGFRRFLIHKLIEDNFASHEVAAFSIGQDISRRIVICYKGLISEAASKGLPATIPQLPKPNMIDKEKPSRLRQTPTAAVYRPPAARLAENRKSMENVKPPDTKQTRVRRPDQQMYVPRPKRASYDNDLPRSRSRSSSRLSLDSDQSSDVKGSAVGNSEESRTPKQNGVTDSCREEINLTLPITATDVKLDKSDIDPTNISDVSEAVNEKNVITNTNHEFIRSDHPSKTATEINTSLIKVDEISNTQTEEIKTVDEKGNHETCLKNPTSKQRKEDEMQVDCPIKDKCLSENAESQNKTINMENTTQKVSHSSFKQKTSFDNEKDSISKNEAMETISISSDSRSEDSNSSFVSSSDSAADTDDKKCCKHKRSEKMDTDYFQGNNSISKSKSRSPNEEKTRKNVEPSTAKISEVLVISDSNSSDDSMKSADSGNEKQFNLEKSADNGSEKKCNVEKSKSQLTLKVKSAPKQATTIDPNEYDWETLYDDSGECLVPDLMEELTSSVGKVRVTSADSDYRPYQSVEERTSDGECVIEIYDFPAEFKTTDLFNIFAAYRNKNFQIKWVDDTHALGIFPSPLMADEVLACTLPFVKTRPLRLGIAESRNKARNLVLPPLPAMERPKTCSALAKRLVSGALGLRIPTSSQEREKEKQVLKEAREKRRLEAKQREAAWDGTLTSSSVI